NCSYVKVAAGPFRLTTHRVATPGSFVAPCVSRKQDAAVNEFMDGYVLHEDGVRDGAVCLCVPLPALEQAKEIAVYALHGTWEQDGRRTPFLEIAAPDADLEVYRWQCSFNDLKQAYLADSRAKQDGEQ